MIALKGGVLKEIFPNLCCLVFHQRIVSQIVSVAVVFVSSCSDGLFLLKKRYLIQSDFRAGLRDHDSA